MSGEKYTVISSLPPLLKGLVKSIQAKVWILKHQIHQRSFAQL